MGSKRTSGDGSGAQAAAVLLLFAALMGLSFWVMSIEGLGGGGPGNADDDEADEVVQVEAATEPDEVAPGADERLRAVEAARATKPGDLLRESSTRLLGEMTAGLPPAPDEPKPSSRPIPTKETYDDLLWPRPPER